MNNIMQYLYNNMLSFYSYKLFDVKEKKYIITNAASAIFEIDDIIIDLLNYEGKAESQLEKTVCLKYGETKLQEVLKNLEENYIIKSENNMKMIQEVERDAKSVNSVTLMVCQECNLRCSYCFGEGGEYKDKGKMSFEIGKKAIEFGFDNNAQQDRLSVVFFGGEPLIQFNLIKEWVHFSKTEAIKREKKVTFGITTNATLITPEIADFFKENHFSVTISIDGDKEDNDRNRFYINRQGAYDNILKGVQILQQHGVNVVARGTVTGKNINMVKNLEHLAGLGFKSVHFAPAVNLIESSDLKTYSVEERKMVDYFFDCLKKEDYKNIEKMHNIETYVRRIHSGGMRFTCCGAHIRMIAVDINGDIYPCHRFVSLKEMCVGNIFSGWDEKKCDCLSENLRLSSSSCKGCWAVNLCGGGCPFENYMENHMLSNPNSFVCTANKDILEYVIAKYLELSEEERVKYFDKDNEEAITKNEGD